MDNPAAVAPGFSPAIAALKGGATLSIQFLDTTLASGALRHPDQHFHFGTQAPLRAFSIQVLTHRKGAMPKSMKQYGI